MLEEKERDFRKGRKVSYREQVKENSKRGEHRTIEEETLGLGMNEFPGSIPRSSPPKYAFLKFGLPFLSVVVLGSFLLQSFTKTRYEKQKLKKTRMTQEEEEQLMKKKKVLSIQEEYWRLEQKLDELDQWEQVRVPRPNEDQKEKNK